MAISEHRIVCIEASRGDGYGVMVRVRVKNGGSSGMVFDVYVENHYPINKNMYIDDEDGYGYFTGVPVGRTAPSMGRYFHLDEFNVLMSFVTCAVAAYNIDDVTLNERSKDDSEIRMNVLRHGTIDDILVYENFVVD